MSDNFGERAATEEEIEDWVELVKAGKRATRAYRARQRADFERDVLLPEPNDD